MGSSLLKIPLEVHLAICSWLLLSLEPPLPEPAEERWQSPEPVEETWQSTLVNFRALGNLALTCKALYRSTASLLYEKVHVPIHPPAALLQLLRHFSLFPDVALNVKSVSVFARYYKPPARVTKSQAEYLFAEARLLGLNVSYAAIQGPPRNDPDSDYEDPYRHEDRYSEDLGGTSCVSLSIALLLSRVPNIREMTLVGVLRTSIINRDWLAYSQKQLFDYPNQELLDYAGWLPDSFVLRSLGLLDIETPTFEVGSHHQSIAAFLRHTPALTRLRVSVGNYSGHVVPLVRQPLPQLRHVHLPDGQLQNLAAVAEYCPAIESCYLGEDNGEVSFERFDEFVPSSNHVTIDCVLEALLPLRLTLRELHTDWQLLYATTIHQLGLLPQFTALRSLRLILVEWPVGDVEMVPDILPPYIESLCLGGMFIEIDTIALQLRDCIQAGRFLGLKEFGFVLVNVHDSTIDEMERLVGWAFEGTGVECRAEWTPWMCIY
ncbi:hypothetical protein BT67DRAFT_440864 [Trichocladium antarcticum]|uniref:F-box domain-containing protein n=1 Tax=Trichocladium antarcticum TaxID=1450529 RepID=A0AAN6ZER5_9PEZI|nr:hypothetical protein BT67DRAFT_440864 [Trichocladium antarcticum]